MGAFTPTPKAGSPLDSEALMAGSLPRNANGKIDRRLLAHEFADLFQGAAT